MWALIAAQPGRRWQHNHVKTRQLKGFLTETTCSSPAGKSIEGLKTSLEGGWTSLWKTEPPGTQLGQCWVFCSLGDYFFPGPDNDPMLWLCSKPNELFHYRVFYCWKNWEELKFNCWLVLLWDTNLQGVSNRHTELILQEIRKPTDVRGGKDRARAWMMMVGEVTGEAEWAEEGQFRQKP